MKSKVLILSFIFLVLSGCQHSEMSVDEEEKATEQIHINIEGTTYDNDFSTENYKKLKMKADKTIEKLVNGIVQNDYNIVFSCLSSNSVENYGVEMAKSSIKSYRVYFKGRYENLRIKFLGHDLSHFKSSGYIDYIYILYNEAFIIKKTKVRSYEDKAYIVDKYLYYPYFAERLVDSFIDGIKKQDKNKVASSLSVDIITYPVSEAEKIISEYNKTFDIITLKYNLVGVNETGDEYIFRISDSKYGKKTNHVNHIIRVMCGDGICGIENNLGPSLNEVGELN
ncbi:hypothetical protein [Caloranaerobacter ferrireducens]|uniref:hypothetical protein n=1 Tax=Caloranaerobacter ferrireducens TaxID=1323370 RepID=UPI00084D0EE0|nr:hypothetical protein [Caloranaerobacter ferrireducens]